MWFLEVLYPPTWDNRDGSSVRGDWFVLGLGLGLVLRGCVQVDVLLLTCIQQSSTVRVGLLIDSWYCVDWQWRACRWIFLSIVHYVDAIVVGVDRQRNIYRIGYVAPTLQYQPSFRSILTSISPYSHSTELARNHSQSISHSPKAHHQYLHSPHLHHLRTTELWPDHDAKSIRIQDIAQYMTDNDTNGELYIIYTSRGKGTVRISIYLCSQFR